MEIRVQCTKCGIIKPRTDYYNTSVRYKERRYRYLRKVCKTCLAAQMAAGYQERKYNPSYQASIKAAKARYYLKKKGNNK